MIRQALEARGVILSNKDFKIVLDEVTNDIKFNQISFNKRINLNGMIEIAINFAGILKRCA